MRASKTVIFVNIESVLKILLVVSDVFWYIQQLSHHGGEVRV